MNKYKQVKEDVAGYEGSSIDIMEVAVSYVESGQDYHDYVVDMVDMYLEEEAFEELQDAYGEVLEAVDFIDLACNLERCGIDTTGLDHQGLIRAAMSTPWQVV